MYMSSQLEWEYAARLVCVLMLSDDVRKWIASSEYLQVFRGHGTTFATLIRIQRLSSGVGGGGSSLDVRGDRPTPDH